MENEQEVPIGIRQAIELISLEMFVESIFRHSQRQYQANQIFHLLPLIGCASHTEKRIECQAKTRPPMRYAGIVDEEAMDVIKNAVPNKGSDLVNR